MNSDIKGCSTCPAGGEQFETFVIGSREYVQYDYRDPLGDLFSTIATSLEEARNRRDKWLQRH